MVYSQINQKKKTTITLDMLHLKMVAVVEAVLVVLEVLVVQISLIFLKIFLETLVVEAEEVQEEVQITEVLI